MATIPARPQAVAGAERAGLALKRAALANHLQRLIDRYAIGLVLDVGAHEGEYGRLLRGIGFGGQIVSYEPGTSAFEKLAASVDGDDGWVAYPIALGTADGQATLNVARCTDFSSFRTLSEYGASTYAGANAEAQERVEVRRLDQVIREHAPSAGDVPALLKIDTQGWDMDVLEGANGVLDRFAAIQTEVALRPLYEGVPDLGEVLRELDARGFALSGVFPVTIDSHDLRLVEIDCIAVRT